jgi:ubiquinone/menaquinone biosynthesis C-methylase UbiE
MEIVMSGIKEIFDSSGHAKSYDQRAKEHNIAEVMFGVSYKDIKEGQVLVDFGIGTGRTSELFYKAGLNVSGMDFSQQMLLVCKENFPDFELKEHDLKLSPYPYQENFADIIICAGVIHMLKEACIIFQEASRILKKGGIFTFSLLHCNEGEEHIIYTDASNSPLNKSFETYKHTASSVFNLLEEYGFKKSADVGLIQNIHGKEGILKVYSAVLV